MLALVGVAHLLFNASLDKITYAYIVARARPFGKKEA